MDLRITCRFGLITSNLSPPVLYIQSACSVSASGENLKSTHRRWARRSVLDDSHFVPCETVRKVSDIPALILGQPCVAQPFDPVKGLTGGIPNWTPSGLSGQLSSARSLLLQT